LERINAKLIDVKGKVRQHTGWPRALRTFPVTCLSFALIFSFSKSAPGELRKADLSKACKSFRDNGIDNTLLFQPEMSAILCDVPQQWNATRTTHREGKGAGQNVNKLLFHFLEKNIKELFKDIETGFYVKEIHE